MNPFARASIVAGAALASTLALAQTHWDLPTAYPAGNFDTANLVQFAADVVNATRGQLRITIHSDASLFRAAEIKRAVQTGQVQIGEILLSNYANENPLFGIDVQPFVATSYEEAKKLEEASRPALEKLLAGQGLMLLYTVPWPPRGLFSKKPLYAASDLRGMKFRACNAATARIADLFGAQPVTIEAAELSQALATGAVESYISSSATGYDTRTFEHLKYFYDMRAWLPKNAVIVNRKAFEELAEPQRKALLAVADQAGTRGWKLSQEKTKWYMDQLRRHGMQIEEPSQQMREQFRRLGETMLGEWVRRAGAEGKAILDAYRQR